VTTPHANTPAGRDAPRRDEPPPVAARTRRDATVAAAQAAFAARGHAGKVAVASRHGQVTFAAVAAREDAAGVAWVEVLLDGDTDSGERRFRIFNPPQLAADPAGDVEVAGVRYRRDPLAALAEAIAANGGAARPSKRRGGRR
jgi:hypothetical protein